MKDDKGREIEDVNEHVELDEAALIRETMVGEYMELTTNTLKGMDKTFNSLNERDQTQMIQRLKQQAMIAISRMVKLVASADSTTIVATLVNPKKGKKEITASLEMFLNEPAQAELFQFANKKVVLVLIDEEDFIDEGELPEADPDQPALNGFE